MSKERNLFIFNIILFAGILYLNVPVAEAGSSNFEVKGGQPCSSPAFVQEIDSTKYANYLEDKYNSKNSIGSDQFAEVLLACECNSKLHNLANANTEPSIVESNKYLIHTGLSPPLSEIYL